MTGKDHANLLGIFSYVFAGIQSIITLIFGAYLLIVGGLTISAALGGDPNGASGLPMMFVIVAIFGTFFALGLTSIIFNVKTGRRLRGDEPPSQRSLLFNSILNCCAIIFGGMFSMPFGAAVGAYGIWFATSDVGKRYLAGMPEGEPSYLNPPPAQRYAESFMQENEPYKWR
jgi:hypothetical protein